MTVFVTSAQLRNGNPSQLADAKLGDRGKGSSCARRECASDALPVFMSMATMLPNGGLSSGNPRGPGR